MRKELEQERRLSSAPKTLGIGVMFALLLVFVVVVSLVTFSVREDIRSQLLDVDAHVLSLLVQNEIEQAEREANLIFEFETIDEIEIWLALLETSGVEGVFAIQFFDPEGSLVQSSSSSLVGQSIPERVEARLSEASASSEFSAEVWLSDFVDLGFREDKRVAVSDIYLPLRSSDDRNPLGTARYLMDGSALAKQFVVLDLRLLRQGGVAVGLGGVVIVSLFWLAWKRLSEANARVSRQAARLKKANAELAMLARTSAVGSVTAHLIHGLKNPLAGLRQVVSAQQSGESSVDEEDWKGASDAAERMQRMVEEVIMVLQDASSGLSFETDSSDLFAELESRFKEEAENRSISFSVMGERGIAIDSSVSSIALLVVSNLVKNAIEATPVGGQVSVVLSGNENLVSLRVSDSGPGVLRELRDKLFSPVSSGKSDGAGIGLAISSQLARHIEGSLELLDTDEGGAIFELTFPPREGFGEEET